MVMEVCDAGDDEDCDDGGQNDGDDEDDKEHDFGGAGGLRLHSTFLI